MGQSEITVKVSRSGMPEDAFLELALPAHVAGMSVGQLLELIFPDDAESASSLADAFDLAANPDLPEIYDHIRPVFRQLRHGLCSVNITTGAGRPASPEDAVREHLNPPECGAALPGYQLSLHLSPEYQPLEYAAAMGWDAGEPDLETWLQTCVSLYFVDKHEQSLISQAGESANDDLSTLTAAMCQQDLISLCPNSGKAGITRITEQGRTFIGNLLAETENYIDRYDLFQDVYWDEDTDTPEFDTGFGEDVRVALFIAEGLDPLRTVFLLRLYDGTLDEYADTWMEQVATEDFFDRVLEPLVDRSIVPEERLRRIADAGFTLLETAAEAAGERRLITRIAQRARSSP